MAPDDGQTKRPMISVVAPCYNEEDVVDAFYGTLKEELLRLPDIGWEILLVDDGSKDGTLERLNAIARTDPTVNVYSLSRNFGHQIALTAGLDHASGDAVVVMDSDLQHPPSMIPQMVRLWQQGYDIVSMVRQETMGAPFSKKLTARCFYWLVNRLGDTHLVPGAADFCLLSRAAHQALCDMPERHRFLRGMVSWIGYRRVLIPFDAPARAAGTSKYSLAKMTSLALDAIFSFSTVPIRVATRVGALVAFAALCYMAYAVGRYFFIGDLVSGWASVICTIVIVGGLQLVYLGVMGEYIIRVFEESKGRPLYFLKQRPSPGDGRAGLDPVASLPRERPVHLAPAMWASGSTRGS